MSVGPLNLSDADMTGGSFEALPPGTYEAEVFAIEMQFTKGGGKMPANTPMVSVQFRVTEPEFNNRRVFTRYIIPPAEYNPSAASKMKGMLVRFFMAMGENEGTVRANGFTPDFDDYLGKPCVLSLSRRQRRDSEGNATDQFDNEVQGIKAPGAKEATGLL